ncbi:MAG: YlxR family protein [Oscillospiraceae bacterium]|nr:YlxR family protein [Oscillospiraceae bacterium]
MQKKIPERRCTGCGESKPKKELIRVVRSPEGEISLDFKGKKPGRGAYVCHDLKCLAKARKTKRLEHSLSCEIPDEVYGALEKEMAETAETTEGEAKA